MQRGFPHIPDCIDRSAFSNEKEGTLCVSTPNENVEGRVAIRISAVQADRCFSQLCRIDAIGR